MNKIQRGQISDEKEWPSMESEKSEIMVYQERQGNGQPYLLIENEMSTIIVKEDNRTYVQTYPLRKDKK